MVKKETMRACLSCPLCDNLLRAPPLSPNAFTRFVGNASMRKSQRIRLSVDRYAISTPIEDAESYMVSDRLLASEEGIKKLEAEGKLAQERVQEIDSLSSKLAEKEEELRTKEKELAIFRMLAQAKSEEAAELKVRLDWVTAEELRTKEKELEILQMLAQAKSEEVAGLKRLDRVIPEEELRKKETESEIFQMLAQAKSEEAAELKVRLDRVTAEEETLRKATSPSVAPSEQWVSLEDYRKLALETEQLKKDMGLMESAARMVTGYQMCLRWEKKGGLDRELAVMAKQYWQYRDYVEKQGKSDHFPSLERYQKDGEDDEVHASPKKKTSHSAKAPNEPGLVPLPVNPDVGDRPVEL